MFKNSENESVLARIIKVYELKIIYYNYYKLYVKEQDSL